MTNKIPPVVPNAFRVVINLDYAQDRMDKVLLENLRLQNENETLKNISRGALKEMFNQGKIMIKGQRAKSSSALAKGITYVDVIL